MAARLKYALELEGSLTWTQKKAVVFFWWFFKNNNKTLPFDTGVEESLALSKVS